MLLKIKIVSKNKNSKNKISKNKNKNSFECLPLDFFLCTTVKKYFLRNITNTSCDNEFRCLSDELNICSILNIEKEMFNTQFH